MAENNLDGDARRLRRPGSQQANAEELLAELVRLVDSSGPAPVRSRPPAGTASEPTRTNAEPMQRLEMTLVRPSVEAPLSKPVETLGLDVEQPRADNSYSNDPDQIDSATGRRIGARKFIVSALVLVGVAVFGSMFWLKRVELRPPNAVPSLVTTQGPATTEPASNVTAATSSEAGATPKAPARSLEDQPTDLNARASLNNPPRSDLAPTAIGAAQPTADASAAKPLAASVNPPTVAAPIAAAQPMASQSLDPKPVTAVSLPPDPTAVATPTPSTSDPITAAHSTDAPLPPIRPAAKAAIAPAGLAHQSAARFDLPTKLSNKSDARVAVAKTDATGAKALAERSEPPQREASLKSEKGGKTLNAAPAPTEAQAAPPEQPAAAQQPKTNPVVHAFKNMVGAVAGFIPFMPH